jgi:hypothetical protein
MSRDEKLLRRFQGMPLDFTWNELVRLLSSLGFTELTTGKTAGSRRVFYAETKNLIIRLHKPHPGNELKMYQMHLLLETLKKGGLL